jgi:hypothetical protein
MHALCNFERPWRSSVSATLCAGIGPPGAEHETHNPAQDRRIDARLMHLYRKAQSNHLPFQTSQP